MKPPITFAGRLGRAPYIVAAAGALLSQHAAVALYFKLLGRPLYASWSFAFFPLRSVARLHGLPPVVYSLAFALMLLVAWVLAILSFRRAVDAALNRWIAAAAIVPVIQIPMIALLAVAPSRASGQAADEGSMRAGIDWATAVQGMLAGMGLTVFAVFLGALVFGSYGYGMFVASPFLIGATTGYLANRKSDLHDFQNFLVCGLGLFLGGIALVLVALEGVVCIVLASPIAALVGMVGGVFGQSVARWGRRRASSSLASVALLPLVFISEQLFPPAEEIHASRSMAIAASPMTVWKALIRMDKIGARPSLPFRLGIAYPTGARLVGTGVRAVRFGEFSTGTAVEEVTSWAPGRSLGFRVLSDPPAMRELSPYSRVYAPHVAGYFRTTATEFTLLPTSGGTRVVLTSNHELRLDPVLYWLPLTNWIIRQNDDRVLAWLRDTAQSNARGATRTMLLPEETVVTSSAPFEH